MENKIYSYYLVRYKPDILLKFAYKESIGIYYELIKEGKRLEGKIIHKNAFSNFNIFYSKDLSINLICQDICGDIILYKLRKGKWSFKALLYMKYNKISPINFYGYENNEGLKFLYSDTNFGKGQLISINFSKYLEYDFKKVIFKEENVTSLDYKFSSTNKENFILISSNYYSKKNLIIKRMDIENENLINSKDIIMENCEYEDMSFLHKTQTCHFLSIKEYDELRTINYKVFYYKNDKYCSNEFKLFEGKDIKSCILSEINEVIFAFWISNDILYSSYLIDELRGFSKPFANKSIRGKNIKKINLYTGDRTMETYVLEDALELRLIIEEEFKEKIFNITTNNI